MISGSFMYTGADIPTITLPFYGTGEQEVFQKGFLPSPEQKVFPKTRNLFMGSYFSLVIRMSYFSGLEKRKEEKIYSDPSSDPIYRRCDNSGGCNKG